MFVEAEGLQKPAEEIRPEHEVASRRDQGLCGRTAVSDGHRRVLNRCQLAVWPDAEGSVIRELQVRVLSRVLILIDEREDIIRCPDAYQIDPSRGKRRPCDGFQAAVRMNAEDRNTIRTRVHCEQQRTCGFDREVLVRIECPQAERSIEYANSADGGTGKKHRAPAAGLVENQNEIRRGPVRFCIHDVRD